MDPQLPHNTSILCVFAHPDDESFGPGGSIAKLAQHNQVNLLCVTDGNNPGVSQNLIETRRQELETAAATLGIHQIFRWEYADGSLSNQYYHQIADKISELAHQLKATHLITFEPRGLSGHLDHIALAMICAYVKRENNSITDLWYFCQTKTQQADFGDDYFIYVPPAYDESEVDLSIDVSDVWETKLAAIQAHVSQQQDIDKILTKLQRQPKVEHFLVAE